MAVNHPPASGIRVPADTMVDFVTSLFEAAGSRADQAGLLSVMLVETDLRGTFSHGTRTAARYVGEMLNGEVNPHPNIRSSPTSDARSSTCVVDGDGGLGHLPCHEGMTWAIDEAKKNGLAACTTRNHGHIGAAGTFSRMALPHGLIGLAISSRRLEMDPGQSVLSASPGPPISIAIPTRRQPPLVMDMGTDLPADPKLLKAYPQLYWRSLALGSTLHALGGILAGIHRREFQEPASNWTSDQGAFLLAADVDSFMPLDEFTREVDLYVQEARRMRPLPGFDEADLSGGLEADATKRYRRDGIPISDDHRRDLEEAAARLSVAAPFAVFENTRFQSASPSWLGRSLRIDAAVKILRRIGNSLTWLQKA